MKKLICLVAASVLSLLLLAMTMTSQTKTNGGKLPMYQDLEGYKVLSVVLDSSADAWKTKTLTIDSATVSGKYASEIKAECKGLPSEFESASADFDQSVKNHFLLQREFSLSQKYELHGPNSRSRATGLGPSTQNGDRNQGGTYYVAPVGFDKTRTHAIAFVQYLCGFQCGSSMFHFLHKTDKGWEEVQASKGCGRIY